MVTNLNLPRSFFLKIIDVNLVNLELISFIFIFILYLDRERERVLFYHVILNASV